MIVLGLDPGFKNVGWAVLEFSEPKPDLLALGLIQTEKNAEAESASKDNLRRGAELHQELNHVIVSAMVEAICAEAMSFPRNAVVAAKMSMAWGIIISLADCYKIPIYTATPMEVKKSVVGLKTATKGQVQKAINARFKNAKELIKATGLPKGSWEHPYDAAASALACEGEARKVQAP